MNSKTLGHYRVGEQLGRGGMGEVYKADDISLDRKVALKFLPEAFTGDPERMARFEREAKLLASLNHPNIAAIHGLEQAEGKRFIVMELVEGETLAQRLSKGALPVDEALGICKQIAAGLEAAHEKGVIHRDLKPANVMVTEGDRVKILDFGLAKALSGETQSADASQSPTITEAMTQPGIILGTAAYMSPEQAKGKAVDKRADIWAFGCILYECLTGKRAFEGETVTETLAAVLRGEPDWMLLPAETSPFLGAILRRCVQKDPSLRLRDIGDARIDIELEQRVPSNLQTEGLGVHMPGHSAAKREALAWTLFALVVVIAMGIYWFRVRLHPVAVPQMSMHASIPLKTAQVVTSGQFAHIAISANGRRLVFRQNSSLCIRPIDSDSTNVIADTDNAAHPTFSPDEEAIAFAAGGRIKRVAVSGGPVTELASVSVGAGMAWGEDGWIYFSSGLGTEGIWRVPAAGGRPEAVTRVDDAAGENAHSWPQLLPGGKALLFTALGPSGGSEDSRIVAQFMGSKERKILVEKGMFGRYLPSGHLIYATNRGTVFAVPFDPGQVSVRGTPVPVLSDIGTATWGGAAFLAVSDSGTLIFLKRSVQPDFLLRVVDSAGREENTPFKFDTAMIAKITSAMPNLKISPDGRKFAITGRALGTTDVWIVDAKSGEAERLTFDPAEDEFPVWSPDGRTVAYTSAKTGSTRRIFIKNIEGGAQPKLVRTWPRHVHISSWSPDGRWLAAYDYSATNGNDIWAVPVDGKDAIAVANGPASESNGEFSPDGRWIAYVSNESGRSEVYVVSFPSLDSRRQVSTDGGTRPQWDHQGRTLFYLQSGYLIAHEVSTAGEFNKGRAKRLFATNAVDFQVAPGSRFVLTENNSQPPDSPLYLISNWFEELKQKVPSGKK